MPVVLSVREIKLEIQSHEWDKYARLGVRFGNRVKYTEPEQCECPFVTKWGNCNGKRSLAVFEVPTQSQLFDSYLSVDVHTGPRVENGSLDRFFGRGEFYLGTLKIKQPLEILHLTCSLYDPLKRQNNPRVCPRMILKCRWSWKKKVTDMPAAPSISPSLVFSAPTENQSENIAVLTPEKHFNGTAPQQKDRGNNKDEEPAVEENKTSIPPKISRDEEFRDSEEATVVEEQKQIIVVKVKRGVSEDTPNLVPRNQRVSFSTNDGKSQSLLQPTQKKTKSKRPSFTAPKTELADTLSLLLGGAQLLRQFAQTGNVQ